MQENNSLTVNLSRAQVYFALIAHSVVILSASVGLALSIGRMLVRDEFNTQLDLFHKQAIPEINQLIDSKITESEKDDVIATSEFRESVVERLKSLETVDKEREERLRRIETKLDLLLERR